MTEPIAARLRRIQRQVAAFHRLHADELQLIIDEMRDLAADLEAGPGEGAARTTAATEPTPLPSTPSDPAAASPKRAKWLAEQERRSHLTRRELLRRREDDGGEA